MYCNKIIHDELDNIICPLCCKQIKEQSVRKRNVVMNSAWKTEIIRLFALINCGQEDAYDPIQ